jgi:hypothetical protein
MEAGPSLRVVRCPRHTRRHNLNSLRHKSSQSQSPSCQCPSALDPPLGFRILPGRLGTRGHRRFRGAARAALAQAVSPYVCRPAAQQSSSCPLCQVTLRVRAARTLYVCRVLSL